MLAAAIFIHTQIVDVQRLNIGEDVVVHMLLEHAEGIAPDGPLVVKDKNGLPVVVNQVPQFLGGVLGTDVEQVRPSLVMDQIHLGQQFHDGGHVPLLCSANFHCKHSFEPFH